MKETNETFINIDDFAGEDEELFITIDNDDYNAKILSFCKSIFSYKMVEDKDGQRDLSKNYVSELVNLLKQLPRPFTIVQETYYVDATFRDSYYNYFSNQHFPIRRYSRRLSFFEGYLDFEKFFSTDAFDNEFMGSCVINPLLTGIIGRTLINPKFLIDFSQLHAYMRLSTYKVHVYGKTFSVKAFPYRMQDEETMRCTEVTMLNILDYYSNSYPNYRSVVPSEILESEQRHNHERVLPSKGMTYPVLTKVLSEFGFEPKLYNIESVDEFTLSKVSPEDEMRRWLHYYVESGIPVALNLLPSGNIGSGHSIVCIGHGKLNDNLWGKAENNKWISWKNRASCHPIINSADLYDEYVIVDDNIPIYQCRNINELSALYLDMKLQNIAVPLYKRMFLDAPDASSIIRSVLHDEKIGIDVWTDKFLEKNEDIVIRMFMASSHSLKNFRVSTLKNEYIKATYAIIPMPRFVWVCELYRKSDYNNLEAFGEIVIDATSTASIGNDLKNIIMMHYPNVIGVRYPDQYENQFDDMAYFDDDNVLFPGFNKNLSQI